MIDVLVKSLLVLATVFAPISICVAIAMIVGYAAGALASQWRLTRRFGSAVRTGVTISVGLIGALGLVIAFGTVANAEAGTKAAMLARGISEAVRCTAYPLLGAVGVVILLWLTWR